MPKKRTSAESSKDEQTSEGSYVFQEDDDAKRAKLASLCDTTLQDLPTEVLECILVKAVAMEVKGLRLAKCVWKEKSDLVISRLRTVCSQWNNIFTTDFFTREVHRALDGEETIRLEILHQPSVQLGIYKLTTLKDEIFLLRTPIDRGCFVINVYDRNNMAEVKDVIPLPGIRPTNMAACSVSNCVYILDCPSIFRITKDEQHHFKMSPWIYDRRLKGYNRGPISVSGNGNLIIVSSQECPGPESGHRPNYWYVYNLACVSLSIDIYNVNGSLQHNIMLAPDICGFTRRPVNSVIQKSNGNIVLLSADYENEAKLLEIDASGKIVRQYQTTLDRYGVASFADIHGRILINDFHNEIELLDPEFNLLETAGPRLSRGHLHSRPQIHFNSERNEMVLIEMHQFNSVSEKFEATVLNIFRFTEE